MRTRKEAEGHEIAGYWRDAAKLPPLPEFVYYVIKGYGVDSMALWRLKVVAEFEGRMSFGPKGRERWSADKDKLLWAGPKYQQHPSEVIGRRYSYSKVNCDLTLEAAIARMHAFAAEFKQELAWEFERIADRERQVQRDREYITGKMKETIEFNLQVEDLKV